VLAGNKTGKSAWAGRRGRSLHKAMKQYNNVQFYAR
jgi:hypothetical protein